MVFIVDREVIESLSWRAGQVNGCNLPERLTEGRDGQYGNYHRSRKKHVAPLSQERIRQLYHEPSLARQDWIPSGNTVELTTKIVDNE